MCCSICLVSRGHLEGEFRIGLRRAEPCAVQVLGGGGGNGGKQMHRPWNGDLPGLTQGQQPGGKSELERSQKKEW